MNGETQERKVLCDIAHCTFEIVNRLLSRDQLLAKDLRSDTTGSRQIYREECITTEMAATLRERFPKYVEITLFTPWEESRQTGADWYWRFEKGDRAIHARVQAKRVQRSEFGQEDSDGHVDIKLAQLNQLLQDTNQATSQLPGLEAWLATYARFQNVVPPCGEVNLQRCRNHWHEGRCLNQVPSLWIAEVGRIRNIPQLRTQVPSDERDLEIPVREIITNSVRLDCHLPCIAGPETSDGPASKGFVLSDGLPSYQDCIRIIESDNLLRYTFEGALRIAI